MVAPHRRWKWGGHRSNALPALPVQDAEDIAETCSGHMFVATKVCGGLTAMPLGAGAGTLQSTPKPLPKHVIKLKDLV